VESDPDVILVVDRDEIAHGVPGAFVKVSSRVYSSSPMRMVAVLSLSIITFLFSLYIFILTTERVQTVFGNAPQNQETKKKAFGRRFKSAESLCFSHFSTLPCGGHCIKMRLYISTKNCVFR